METTKEGIHEYRPPYGAAAIASACILILYVITLAPSTGFWDTSEYIATAHILGIPHPPGNPFFVVLARTWSLLLAPLGLPVAVRINLLAAVTSAAASGFLFLVVNRVLSSFFDERRFALAGAAAAALIGATAFTVWGQSTVNEKVYTIRPARHRSRELARGALAGSKRRRRRRAIPAARDLLDGARFDEPPHVGAAGARARDLHSDDRPQRPAPPGVPGARGTARASRIVVQFCASGAVPRSIRLSTKVPRHVSRWSARPRAIYTNGKSGCQMLADNLTRRQYQTPPVTQRKAPFKAQMAIYLQYFDWQWARGVDASELPGTARVPFTLLFGALGALGLYAAWKADHAIFAYLLVLLATLSIGSSSTSTSSTDTRCHRRSPTRCSTRCANGTTSM